MSDETLLHIDRNIMGDLYTSAEVMDNLTILCDDFGSRFGGTEGERRAVDFMLGKLTGYGLHKVHTETVEYVGWTRGEAQLEIVSPIRKEIPCITLPHSPPADLEGVVVDMGDGAPADFDARAAEIRGKLVMTTSKVNPQGVKRWIHRGEKYGRSLLAGAAGFIFVNHYPGFGPATGGIGRNDQAPVPGFSISKEDGAFLERLIKRKGEVKVRLTSSDSCEPMVSWNIVGDLPGTGNGGDIVMIGSHYDGHDISQGAGDPASGAVSVMEAARLLAKYAADSPRSIRFVLWGIEEIGLLGSKAYVREHADELDAIRFYLNMDAAGTIDSKGIVLNEWPDLVPLIEQWSQDMALDFGVKQSVGAHSDHFPFMQAGVPTGSLGSVGGTFSGGRGFGHTMYDTLDKVSLASLREAAALSARVVMRMAREASWPIERRSEEAVSAILNNEDNREENEFRALIEEYYANLG